jgi:hypothetical protein
MRSLPWSLDGAWYRANLHAHTNRSDGMASPTEVAELYARHGYDAVALTDHFLERYGWPLTGPEHVEGNPITVLRGAELHTGNTRAGHLWHMLAIGLPGDFAPPTAEEAIGALVARAVEAGAFVAVPHPSWSMLSDADMADVSPFHAVEVWNATADDHNGRPDSTHAWRSLLENDRNVGAIAADDTHLRPERADAVCAWTMIRATGPDDLVRALRAGAYYASTGPSLHDVRVEDGEVIVSCSPSQRAWLCGTGFTSVARRGVGATEWRLPIERLGSTWATVTIEDAWGRRAWTNAFDVAEHGPDNG